MSEPTAELSVTLEEPPDQEHVEAIRRGLTAYNSAQAGPDDYRPFAIVLRDAAGTIVGGLYGATFWGWLAIDLFWIEERFRGQGYGERILAQAETEAVRRGCHHALLDTMEFQAPEFYRRRGYEVFGELRDLPISHRRFYMAKDLTGAASEPT